MPLVLAIEPDLRQAAILKRVIKQLVHADLVLVESRDAAIAALSSRVPDVVLVTALLSPRDEEELIAHLRGLDGADHLQTHTIPQLASSGGDVTGDDAPSGGLLGRFRRKKEAEPIPGCDPAMFADEVRAFLQRAAEMKSETSATAVRPVERAAEQREPVHREAGASSAPIDDSASAWSSPFEWRRSDPPQAATAGGETRTVAREPLVTSQPLAVIAEEEDRRRAEAERARLEAENAENERRRRAAEAEVERLRVEAEAEAERLRAEAAAEARRARERAEADARAKAEEDAARLRAKLEAEAAAERERLRLEAEAKAAAERERLRREAEAKAERERRRLEAEAAAERERLRVEAEARAERERRRLEAEAAAERERLRREAEAERERLRLEAEAAAERERRRLAAEAAAAQRERERLEAEAAAAERERQRLEAEAAAAERERLRVEAEVAQERERLRLEAEALAAEVARAAAERERLRIEAEALAAHAAERDRVREAEALAAQAAEEALRAEVARAEAEMPDAFAEFREGADEERGIFRLMPMAMWTRREVAAPPPAPPASGSDLQALLSHFALPPQVAGMTYPRGCRIRRVRVPAQPSVPRARSAHPVILSKRALDEMRTSR